MNIRLMNLALALYIVLEVAVIFYIIEVEIQRLKLRRHQPKMPELIREGGEYTIEEDVELEEVERREEPPIEVQGEPWGWTKPGPKPRGWREDGKYGE